MKLQTKYLVLVATGLMTSTWAFSADQSFQEADKACRATTEAHPFRIRFSIDGPSSFRLEPDTPLTQCLSTQSQPQDELGEARRLSLGATLGSAVRECSDKYGRTENFVAEFTPAPQGHFDVRLGTGADQTRMCIAMLTGIVQPFGPPAAAPAR